MSSVNHGLTGNACKIANTCGSRLHWIILHSCAIEVNTHIFINSSQHFLAVWSVLVPKAAWVSGKVLALKRKNQPGTSVERWLLHQLVLFLRFSGHTFLGRRVSQQLWCTDKSFWGELNPGEQAPQTSATCHLFASLVFDLQITLWVSDSPGPLQPTTAGFFLPLANMQMNKFLIVLLKIYVHIFFLCWKKMLSFCLLACRVFIFNMLWS